MSTKFLRVLPVWLIASVPGCGGFVTAPDLVGPWGGDHVALQVKTAGATLEYDCAHGTIDGPVMPGFDGSFDVRGTHVFEHGGPVGEDEPPDTHPARYVGWTDGATMTLEVILLDTGDFIGTFSLAFGEASRLFKCL